MEIYINENFRLTNDGSHNIIIEERKLIKSTKDGVADRYEWKDARYHGKLETACIALIDIVAIRSEAESIQELVDELRQIKSDIVQAVMNTKECECAWELSETSTHTLDTKMM
ncbi:hypothetical protein ACWGPW_24285 [Paenibacillus chitinolyticus]